LKRLGPIAAAGLLLALGAAGAARGEVEQSGNLIVSLGGGISPHALPRAEPAPVTVSIDSRFKAADGADPPPQLRRISIAINRDGKIFDRGLPTCRVRTIQPATIGAARRICGGAIVGGGRVQVRVDLPGQRPFTFEGPLLVFNAKRSGGHRTLLAQVYGRHPPSAFVLTFEVFEQTGGFGTVIRTVLPRSAWKWAYVTRFEMRLHRIYTYDGERHSFVSAACAAPAGFPGAIYEFADADFGFAEGRQVALTLNRDCRVR
jgi:hypothetical protein